MFTLNMPELSARVSQALHSHVKALRLVGFVIPIGEFRPTSVRFAVLPSSELGKMRTTLVTQSRYQESLAGRLAELGHTITWEAMSDPITGRIVGYTGRGVVDGRSTPNVEKTLQEVASRERISA